MEDILDLIAAVDGKPEDLAGQVEGGVVPATFQDAADGYRGHEEELDDDQAAVLDAAVVVVTDVAAVVVAAVFFS